MDQIFFQNPKNLIFGPFLGTPNPTGDFFKNWAASLYLFYDYLISCKNLEKIDQPIAKSSTAKGQTGKRANGRTNRANVTGNFRQRGCPKIKRLNTLFSHARNQARMISLPRLPRQCYRKNDISYLDYRKGKRANGRTDRRTEQMLQETSASAGAQKLSD